MENASEQRWKMPRPMPELRPARCCCNSTGILSCAAFEVKTPWDVARKEEEEEFPPGASAASGVKQGEPEPSAAAELTPLAGTRQTRAGGARGSEARGRSSWNELGGWIQSCRESSWQQEISFEVMKVLGESVPPPAAPLAPAPGSVCL